MEIAGGGGTINNRRSVICGSNNHSCPSLQNKRENRIILQKQIYVVKEYWDKWFRD